MITYPAGAEKLAPFARDDRSRTREQPGPPLRVEPRPPILGSPHQVDPEREMRVGHRLHSVVLPCSLAKPRVRAVVPNHSVRPMFPGDHPRLSMRVQPPDLE